MQNWERAVTRTSHMSRLYLGYCLENELNQKHNFVLNTVCFYWLPVALRCHFRWRHISSIECGGSGSSFGGVCIHSRLNSTKTTWFPVSFIAFQWYCYKCEESGEHYWVSVHAHWLYGVMCPNECKGPGEQFGCLHMRLGTRLSDCAGPGSSLGVCACAVGPWVMWPNDVKTCKLGQVANLNNRSYCLCCSVIGYILY